MELTMTEQLDLKLRSQAQPPPLTLLPKATNQPKTPTSTLVSDIALFKANMLQWANQTLEEGKNYLDIKEMKDLNSIVKDIEQSSQVKDTVPNINILVQNMLDLNKDDI